MIWVAIIAGAVGCLAGVFLAGALGLGKHNDLLSANDYLQQEVRRWREEYEGLRKEMRKPSR